jgi:hypothetical protein
MTDLSPAAKVLDAFLNNYTCRPAGNVAFETDRNGLAAALCSVADQVVREEPLYGGDQRWEWERDARQASRKKILAIATELEVHSQ